MPSLPDTIVIGGGLIGCALAYELARRGAAVTVYDRAEPAQAASWAAAGMLAPYSEEIADPALLALCEASLRAYPGYVAALRERTGVDAHLRAEGTLHVACDDVAARARDERCAAFRRNGADASVLDRSATLEREAMFGGNVRGAVYVANEAHVDNRRLSRALVAACAGAGVRFERAADVALEADAPARARHPDRRTASRPPAPSSTRRERGPEGCAGVPPAARWRFVRWPARCSRWPCRRGFTRGLVWSTGTYLVPRDDGRLLIGATSIERGFDVRVTAGGVGAAAGRRAAHRAGPGGVRAGRDVGRPAPVSHDGRPYLGATAIDGYFVAAGHGRNGILLAPITARRAGVGHRGPSRPPLDLPAFDPRRDAPEAA